MPGQDSGPPAGVLPSNFSLPRAFQKAQTRSGTLSGGKNHAVV